MRKSIVCVLALLVIGVGLLWARGAGVEEEPAAETGELVQTKPVRVLKSDSNNRGAAPDTQKVTELFEELSGVDIEVEYIPGDAYMDKIQLIIASGEKFDLFNPGPEPWPVLKAKGAIQPLNDLLDNYAPTYKALLTNTGCYEAPPNAWPYVSDADGKIWAFPNVGCIVRSAALSIRTDWLEKLGMEFPKGAAGEPRMSFADYEEYLGRVLKEDPNGNGRNDEFPLVPYREIGTFAHPLDVVQAFFTGFSGERYLANKTVLPAEKNAKYKDMLAKFREWYSKGYLHREFFVLKREQVNDLVISDRVGSSMGWDSDHVRAMAELQKNNPDAYMTIIPPPTDPPGGVAAYKPQVAYGAATYLSATAESPEFAVKVFDWAAQSLDNNTLLWKGIEGEHFKWVDKPKLTIELIGDTTRYQSALILWVSLFPCPFWLKEVGEVDAVRQEYILNEDVKHPSYNHIRPFDEGVVYVTQGTPAEFLTGDGKTKLQEAKIKVIIGEMDLDDWDDEVAEYMEIEGNTLSEVWTKQYYEQRK